MGVLGLDEAGVPSQERRFEEGRKYSSKGCRRKEEMVSLDEETVACFIIRQPAKPALSVSLHQHLVLGSDVNTGNGRHLLLAETLRVVSLRPPH